MKLQELIRRFRVLAKDTVEPYRAEDEDVVAWLNEAQDQACIRARLLVEDSNPDVCCIALTPGTYSYALHPKVYEIVSLRIGAPAGQMRAVALHTREWLDANVPDWRDYPRLCAMAIQDDTRLRLVGQVEQGEQLVLEAYRLPMVPMELPEDPDNPKPDLVDEPEIHEAHHVHLIQWALHKAFSVPDSELFDPNRAQQAEDAFTAYFGPMPDSNLRRSTRADEYQHIRGYLQ